MDYYFGQSPPPPAPPALPGRPQGLAMAALGVALLALLCALPVLWWRLTHGPISGGMLAEVLQVFGTGGPDGAPGWLVAVRAVSVLGGFLALVLGLVALILRQPGRLVAIVWVLALAALAASSLGLTLMIVIGVVLIGVLLLGMGIG